MFPPPPRRCDGFTASELLVAIGITVVLAALMFPTVSSLSKRSTQMGCVSNERQLGVALGSYIGENRGMWPHPEDNRANVEESKRGTWMSRVILEGNTLKGMGQLFPYIKDKRVYVCPADKVRVAQVKNAGPLDDHTVGTMPMSYITRGFNQSANPSAPNLRSVATMGRRSIYACQFAYAASNPTRYPLSFHEATYPVLFSDGSVQVIPFSSSAIKKESPPDINSNTGFQIRFWDYFDGLRPQI